MLQPRYRPGATRRPFVDREQAMATFHRTLDRLSDRDRQVPAPVLSFCGVGGIGKSRLLAEFAERVRERHAHATLDLQVPSLRLQENALATLRAQLGAARVDFPRFDIAYAVWWQRLHPNMRLSREGLSLVEHSEVLSEILDEASGVPVFGAGMRLVDWATRRLRRLRWMRNDPTLQELDTLSISELADAVTYLFAMELAEGCLQIAPFVLFVDAYEALAGGAATLGSAAAGDAWLRDMVGQLRGGLVVVASREHPQWQRHHPDWAQRLQREHVGDLPMDSRMELLSTSGMSDERTREVIAKASAGVPFYLHLAIDSGADTSIGPDGSPVPVSTEAILERFCAHVPAEHVRLLELISVARVFDEEVFQRAASQYHLPGHRLVWQSLIGYSFVYAAGHLYQLHQLMVEALRRRLDKAVAADLHRLLRGLWDERAEAAVDAAAAGSALREAAFHGLWAGDLDATGVLRYADRMLACGALAGVDGLCQDIENYVQRAAEPASAAGLADLVRLLGAEAALVRGEAALAAKTVGQPPATYEDEVAARLAVVAAQADRILGRTGRALATYEAVWRGTSGEAAIRAGLWATDLHMCQGRAAKAVELAAELTEATPVADHEMHGNIARLLALTYRFDFDFANATEHLARARHRYALAGSQVGLANVATNEAELLAHTDPAAALPAVERALELQRDLGAMHELGKVLTAQAVARLRLGDTAGADVSLDEACRYLDSVGYRSGRARAELARAILHARVGRLDDAASCAEWAVTELESAEVYPTLVIAAGHLLEWIGRPADPVTAAVGRAWASLSPTDSVAMLDERIVATLAGMLGSPDVPPSLLYRMASTRGSGATGFYNSNVAVGTPRGRLLVRIPIGGADVMDLRIWPEAHVLAAVAQRVPAAPGLRHVSDEPPYQVQEYIEGELLDEVAPRGRPVPDHVVPDVVRFLEDLHAVSLHELPALPPGWPDDGDTAAFANLLVEVTRTVHQVHRDDFAGLFAALRIPADPTQAPAAGLTSLRPRGFRLVHADIHRKNVILSGGRCRIIDWELALWGDPVYDLATHVHKMGYLDGEHDRLLRLWSDALGARYPDWQQDLRAYLHHERTKSAVVDSVRYAKVIAGGRRSAKWADAAAAKLAAKLNAAYPIWGESTTITAEEAASALAAWR